MIELNVEPGGEQLEVLCLGAHSDDIEIGCGGTLLQLLSPRRARVTWVVFGAGGSRADEARASAEDFLAGADSLKIEIHAFRDGHLPSHRTEIKEVFEGLKASTTPDVIFTHDESDLHQDHALLGAVTRETFRDHLILGYEIPKFDGGLRSPNVFVPLEASTKDRKVDLILRHFVTQRGKPWFDAETLTGLMRLRGVEAAAPSRYAEGFHCRTVRLRF